MMRRLPLQCAMVGRGFFPLVATSPCLKSTLRFSSSSSSDNNNNNNNNDNDKNKNTSSKNDAEAATSSDAAGSSAEGKVSASEVPADTSSSATVGAGDAAKEAESSSSSSPVAPPEVLSSTTTATTKTPTQEGNNESTSAGGLKKTKKQSKKKQPLSKNWITGFETVQSFPFRRAGGNTIRSAIDLHAQELAAIEATESKELTTKRQKKILLAMVLGAGYYYYYHFRTANFYNAMGWDMPVGEGMGGADGGQAALDADGNPIPEQGKTFAMDGTSITKESHSIWVYLNSHRAYLYRDKGRSATGDAKDFIDVTGFENKVEGDDQYPWYQLPMHFSVPVYYPTYAVCFALLFIPFVAVLHSSFNMTSRQMRLGQLGLPNEKAAAEQFKFKTEQAVNTKLSSVAGLTEAKHEVMELIDFIKNPQRYKKLGARLPKGVLLDGPPGVGKTLIAKAVAGEALVPMVSCSGSEFEEVFVGVGAQRVRALFKQARKHAPCVVFIDEIDAFGKKRQSDGNSGSRGTLNALLSELDGFKDAEGVIVLAATNRADVLDGALTRSGRFDRKISLEKPPHKDRVEISKVHLKPLTLEKSLDLDSAAEQLASLTPGCSGADIYNICNEAAIIASRRDYDAVNMSCFHAALERVLVGLTKEAKKFTPDEKKRLAYHEAGHVVLQWFQSKTEPVVKASIVPRGGDKVGVTQKLPTDRFISTQDEIQQKMVAKLGGYVVEELFFEDLSFSASDDLKLVTEMAFNQVCTYGMDPKTVGHFNFEFSENGVTKPFGPKKENQIDQSVSDLVAATVTQARDLMKLHLDKVRVVGGLLLKQETLTAHELWNVLGERPEMTEEFRKFLEARH